jgi:NADH:ubiquinone reductase (H+-translocating)
MKSLFPLNKNGMKPKHIIIVGAGFGGLRCALELEKKFGKNKDIKITLVDKRDYHVFNANLYEVATAEEEFTSINALKKSVVIPFKEILKNKNIEFIKGELKKVDQVAQEVSLHNRALRYDYLVLALGSQIDFMNIPGAEQFSVPFKSLTDSLRMRNAVESLVQSHNMDTVKKSLRIIVAGGGYTGVEVAGELVGLLNIIAWKNNFPREKIELMVVEGSNVLIPGLNDRLSKDMFFRLKGLGVRVQLGSFISKVNQHYIELTNGEKIAHDLLIWSTGVKAYQPEFTQAVQKDKKERLITNGNLQMEGWDRIFIVGDESCVMDQDGRPAPSSAQDAIHQATFVAEALTSFIKNKRPNGYTCLRHGFVVTGGGKWAILVWNKWYIKGFLGYFIKQVADMRYYASIVGWWRAVKYLWTDVRLYSRND